MIQKLLNLLGIKLKNGKDNYHRDLQHNVELMKSLDTPVYIILGADKDGKQFMNIDWDVDNEKSSQFLLELMLNLLTPNIVLSAIDILKNDSDPKNQEVINEVVSALDNIPFDSIINSHKNDMVMSPLDVFKNI